MGLKKRSYHDIDLIRYYNDYLTPQEQKKVQDFFLFEVFGGQRNVNRRIIREIVNARELYRDQILLGSFDPGDARVTARILRAITSGQEPERPRLSPPQRRLPRGR